MRSKLGGKFRIDLGWNAISFFMTALLGVLTFVLILHFRDAATLGVFTLTYTCFMVLSQLAVGGAHLAVQAFVPRRLAQGIRVDAIVASALVQATVTALIVMGIVWLGRDLPESWFNSASVKDGIIVVIPGLLFFSLNKVLLGYLNGARRMGLFAVFQIVRALLILIGVFVLIATWSRPVELSAALFWAELGLFVVLLPVTLWVWKPKELSAFAGALRDNFNFGIRALVGNLLMDVNTRVDVIMLGVFMHESAVGLYSFVATFADGLLLLTVIFRNTINPLLPRAQEQGGRALLMRVIVRNRLVFFRWLGPVILITIPLFPLVLWLFGIDLDATKSITVYTILAIGLAISAGDQPFAMLFGQLGYPWKQTLFMGSVFILNVVLNSLLIPPLGVIGAAISSAIAFVFFTFVLRRLMVIWM